jgi:hypothetical protein
MSSPGIAADDRYVALMEPRSLCIPPQRFSIPWALLGATGHLPVRTNTMSPDETRMPAFLPGVQIRRINGVEGSRYLTLGRGMSIRMPRETRPFLKAVTAVAAPRG